MEGRINSLGFFLPHEAEIILGLPLSSTMPGDALIWSATPNGKFSVRSAYKIAMETRVQADSRSSSEILIWSHIGRCCEVCKFQIRWNILCGDCVKTFYQHCLTLKREGLLEMTYVKSVEWAVNHQVMFFGVAYVLWVLGLFHLFLAGSKICFLMTLWSCFGFWCMFRKVVMMCFH